MRTRVRKSECYNKILFIGMEHWAQQKYYPKVGRSRSTATSGLYNTGLSGYLFYPILHCEFPFTKLYTILPDLSNTWFIRHLIYPTPGLSDTWFIQHLVYPTPDLSDTWFIQHLVYPTPGLSDTWFIQHLVYPTPDLSNTWFIRHLIYLTPGLSNTWFIWHMHLWGTDAAR